MTKLNIKTLNTTKDIMRDKFPIMVKYFLEDTEKYIATINSSIESADIESVKHSAHTLKSSSRQLGADNISDISSNIEKISIEILEDNKNNLDRLKELYVSLQSEFEAVKPEFEKLL